MGHYGAGLFHVPLSGPIKDLSKQIKVEQAFRVGISQLPGTNQNWGVFAPFDGRMIVFDPKSGKSQFEYSWNHDNPAWVAQASSSGRFFIPLTGGGIRVIDVEGTPLKATLIGEIWGLPDGGWFAINPEGRYAASLGAEEHVRLSYKGKTYRFEQFDLFLNRPDLVAKSFGSNHDLVSLLEDVYQRRLKRLGRNISPDAINKAPIIHITSEKKLTSEALTYMMDFEALSQGDDLSEILIYNNGIPVLGERGKPVLSNQTRTLKDKISVSLATGTNQIQIIARSLNGYESLPESVIIHRKARSSHADLFLLAVGVSDYQDDQYDLQYPSKDAGDMIKQFEKSVKDFGQVHVRKLINHEVTKESIKESRKFLAQSRPGDHVVIFIAGHGLLAQKGAAKGEYYYCPHDIDFSNPAVRGLSYQDLIGVVDGIPAQKRLILLDTCHAGELTLGDSRKLLANNKMARGVRAIAPLAVSETDQGGDPLSKRRIEEIFSDLRRGAGATVITASGGMEYAYESDDWKNGVFTYSVLSALRGKQADSNQDQVIQASELINYVAKHVQQLTDGNQRPTVRAKNLFVDFPVIRETRVSIDPETTIQAYLSRSGGYTYESAASMFAPRSKYFGKTVTPSEIRRDVEEYRKKYYAVDYKLKEVVNKKWSSDKLTVTVQYRISYNATYSAKPDRHGSRMATTRRGEMLCEINLQWDGIDWKIHGIKVISSKKLK